MKKFNDVLYGNDSYQKLDIYLPDGDSRGTVVYFHGGGLVSGSKLSTQTADFAASFTAAGYGFVSCDYALYPQAAFPVFLTDAAKAISFLSKHIAEYGGSPKLTVWGQSAGAWMALLLCVNAGYLSCEGVSPESICGWIIESGQTTSHFGVIAKESGLHPLAQRIDERSPLYYLSDSTRFSRMLIIYYSKDMPCRAEQNELFYASVKSFNDGADVTKVMLEGEHCSGSTCKDASGEYPVIKLALDWMR